MNNSIFCPRCNVYLAPSHTHNIEVDYCPNCRGVWLDRGELEKIIERSQANSSSHVDNDHHFNHDSNHYGKHHDNGHDRNRKKGFFSELFDF
jgi:Zn-finger nucleic acid-binding protein